MPIAKDLQTSTSRRRLIQGVAVLAGAAGTLAASGSLRRAAAADAKVPQKAVMYQTTPKGKAQCDACIQWQPPASCKVVEGPISPEGWCSLFAPKPA